MLTPMGKYPDTFLRETTINGSSSPRDKSYLNKEMQAITRFWRNKGIPGNFGEWGTADSAITDNKAKGGITYISHMLNLMDKQKLHWQFYYLNRIYNIDCCYGDNPTNVISQDLINTFTNYFNLK